MFRAHLLHEIAPRERPAGSTTVIKEQSKPLARQAAPVPARVTEVEVGEVHEVRPARGESREESREERRLLDEIRIPSHERTDDPRGRSSAGEVRHGPFAGRSERAAAPEHGDLEPRVAAQRGRASSRKGLESTLLAAESRARKEHPDRVRRAHAPPRNNRRAQPRPLRVNRLGGYDRSADAKSARASPRSPSACRRAARVYCAPLFSSAMR